MSFPTFFNFSSRSLPILRTLLRRAGVIAFVGFFFSGIVVIPFLEQLTSKHIHRADGVSTPNAYHTERCCQSSPCDSHPSLHFESSSRKICRSPRTTRIEL